MKSIKSILLLFLFLIQKSTQICRRKNPKSRPHIIVIIGDDMGHNDFSFRGSNQIPTPNIDSLGYNGIILDKYYVQNACTPTRTAFLTGNYPIRAGMQGLPIVAGQNRSLPLQMPLMSEHLKKLGYKTHIVGKWHLGSAYRRNTPVKRGFDSHFGYWNGFVGYYNYLTDFNNTKIEGFDLHDGLKPAWEYQDQYATSLFTQKSLNIIDNHDTKEPLFLMVTHLAAHAGFDGTELGVPNKTETDIKYSYIQDSHRRLYADVVNQADNSVGQIVQKLLKRNMLQNSIVLFFSDNGAPTTFEYGNSGSNWPLRGMKVTNFEGGIRGSGVIFSPLFKKRAYVSKELMHVTDWLPTFYAAAGGDLRDLGKIDGINQWDTLYRNAPSSRSEILVNINDLENTTSIITHNGKFKVLTGTTTKPEKEGYFGESGRDLNVPPYNVQAVLHSSTNKALQEVTKSSIRVTQIIDMRAEVDLSWCRGSDYLPTVNCTEGCLFDLDEDPCETTNIIDENPSLAGRLLQKIKIYARDLMPQGNQTVDRNSNPQRYNNTWCTWLDDAECVKTPVNRYLIS